MTASTTPMTTDPGGDVRAKIGLLALLAGTALNMLRMAPIFVSDGFEVDQLPPGNPDDLATVATLSGWYVSHVMAILSVPLLVYGFVTVYRMVTDATSDPVAERVTLAGVFGLATGLTMYLVAAVLDGVGVPRAVEHFLDSNGTEREAASTVMTALHETAASFGGHFMATVLFSSGLLGLGLVKLGRHRTLGIVGLAIGVVALAGFVSGIIDVTFQERFPLLGGFVGMMMVWWVALAVRLGRAQVAAATAR